MKVAKELARSAGAGLIATAPMTAAMGLMYQGLPKDERYPLPPEEIARDLTEKTGVREHMSEPGFYSFAALSHFGYGMMSGSLYGGLSRKLKSVPSPIKGLLFGTTVWAAS